MAGTLTLAWRNLGRNRRRTLITGAGLALGMSLCVATYGLMDGMNADILRALTRLDLGHVQVHHPLYPKKKTQKLTLPGHQDILAVAKKIEAVRGITTRLYGFTLASHQGKSAGVSLVGIDPSTERSVTNIHEHLVQGEYLNEQPTPWPKGGQLNLQEKQVDAQLTRDAEAAALAEIDGLDLPPDEPRQGKTGDAGNQAGGGSGGLTRKLAAKLDPPPARPPRVFIGVELAKILKAKLGDRVFVMTQTYDGIAAEVFLEVIGIIKTGTATYDRGRIYVHLQDLQRFLHLDGRVHEVALVTAKAKEAPKTAAGLKALLPKGSGVLVRAWDEIRPDILTIIQLNNVSTGIMVFIIFLVAALGVVNTMLMAVFERTRELGMLKAIGMSGGQIVWLILMETTLLVLASSAVGVGIGLGLDLYMMHHGLNLSSFSEGISIGGMGLNPVIHGAITVQGIVAPVLILSLMCFLGAFYPALRAARMKPAQGMREA